MVETGRRLSLTAVLSVVAHGTSEQTVLSVMMSIFFVKLYAFYAPYSDDTDDVLAEVGQYQILFTFFAGLVVQGELIRSSLFGPLGIALVCINMGVMLVPLRLYYEDYQKTQEKLRRKQEEEDGDNESSNILKRVEPLKPIDERANSQDNDQNDNDNEIKPFPPKTTIEMVKSQPLASPSSFDEFSQQKQEPLESLSEKPSTHPRKVSLKPLPFSFHNKKVLPSGDFIGEDPDWDDYKPAPESVSKPGESLLNHHET